MTETFTLEDLLKYFYQETNSTESKAITEAITENWEVREEYNDLVSLFELLDKIQYNPSRSSVDIILEYSKNTSALCS